MLIGSNGGQFLVGWVQTLVPWVHSGWRCQFQYHTIIPLTNLNTYFNLEPVQWHWSKQWLMTDLCRTWDNIPPYRNMAWVLAVVAAIVVVVVAAAAAAAAVVVVVVALGVVVATYAETFFVSDLPLVMSTEVGKCWKTISINCGELQGGLLLMIFLPLISAGCCF